MKKTKDEIKKHAKEHIKKHIAEVQAEAQRILAAGTTSAFSAPAEEVSARAEPIEATSTIVRPLAVQLSFRTSADGRIGAVFFVNYRANVPYLYQAQYPEGEWFDVGEPFTVPVDLGYGLTWDPAWGYGVRVGIPQ